MDVAPFFEHWNGCEVMALNLIEIICKNKFPSDLIKLKKVAMQNAIGFR